MADDTLSRTAKLSSIRYLTQLRHVREISQGDYIKLKSLIIKDLETTKDKDPSTGFVTLTVPGEVTLVRTANDTDLRIASGV